MRFFSMRIILLVLLLYFHQSYGQSDSLYRGLAKKSIQVKNEFSIPALLIGIGVLTASDDDFINQFEIYEERNEWMPNFRTHADDYLQFAPIVAVFTLGAVAGVKGKHDPKAQLMLLIKTELILTAMVFPLKKLTRVDRPDFRSADSFPSGHTAQAFVAATFLHKEYGKKHPLYSVLAYGVATSVGALRIMNNRHWTADVLMGAGIGILATNIAYLTYREKRSSHKENIKSQIVCLPMYFQGAYGISTIVQLK
jgi:membrane-associated phospholipid phosphatase